MRSKSRSNAQRHQKYRRAYHEANPTCEVRKYLSGPIVAGRPDNTEVHHIAGRGRYGETVGNWITLGVRVHRWITNHSKPGFVLCAYAKWRKGEADWDCWTACKSNYRLSALESDVWIEACQPWPVIDRMRRELLEGA